MTDRRSFVILLMVALIAGGLARSAPGDGESARSLEDEYLRRENEVIKKALFLAELYETKGEFDAAREIYEKVTRLRPNDKSLIQRIAGLYALSGNPEKVVRLYESLAADHPDDSTILMKLADAQFAAGMSDAAAATHEKILRMRVNAPGAFVAIAQDLVKRKAYQSAAALLDRGINLHAGDPYLYYARSDLRFSMEDYAGAVEDAQALARCARGNILLSRQAAVMLARSLVAGGLLEEYWSAAADELSAMETEHARALLDLGERLRKEGRIEPAGRAYARLLKLYPEMGVADEARRRLSELGGVGADG